MLPRLSLYVFAAILTLLAVFVVRLGRTKRRDALADGGVALIGTSLFLVASVAFFAAWQPFAASAFWRDAGSAALIASPLGATLALRYRSRRSILRALSASTLSLGYIMLWLTLNLRGPRGGWTLIEVAQVLPAAATAVAAAACLGWWSKPERAENVNSAECR